MEKVKQTLFIKTIIAEETLKRNLDQYGEGYETYLCWENYNNLLDLIVESGRYEEYRGFKIMIVLRFANHREYKQLPKAV